MYKYYYEDLFNQTIINSKTNLSEDILVVIAFSD